MKLLMIKTEKFSYVPRVQSLKDDLADANQSGDFSDALVGFIHVEEQDLENAAAVETKLIKNLKWAARKNETEQIILHSFAHLAESKADPEFTKALFDRAEERLKNAGYQTAQTPFGFFLDLNMMAPGYPFARLFKSF